MGAFYLQWVILTLLYRSFNQLRDMVTIPAVIKYLMLKLFHTVHTKAEVSHIKYSVSIGTQ